MYTVKFNIFIICACLLLVQSISNAQPLDEIEIPFRQVRALLPADAEIVRHTLKKDVWPDNRAKGDFFKDETIEISFGVGIRAKEGDRDNQKSLGRGIVVKDGVIQLVAGWRAHKKVEVHNDFFDGTLRAKLALAIDRGKPYVQVYDAEVKWNRSALANITSGITLGIVGDILTALEKTVAKHLEKTISDKITELLESKIHELAKLHPVLRQNNGVEHISLRLANKEETLIATIHRPLKQNQQLIFVEMPGSPEGYMPPLVRGDTDFDGDPNVFVGIDFSLDDQTIVRTITMIAEEDGGDHTTAKGTSPPRVVYTAPPGWRIVSWVNPTAWRTLLDRKIRGHKPASLRASLGRLQVYGDHKGRDVGNYTRVSIEYRYRLPVVIERVPARPNPTEQLVQVALPTDDITFRPWLTRGDREFGGNGPRITINGKLTFNQPLALNATKAFLSLAITAQETGGDHSTAKGEWLAEIYKAPNGWRIESVVGDSSWPNLVDYTDTDHGSDVKNTSLGRFTCFGDRNGNDIEEYTGFQAKLDHTVTLRLKRIGN